MTTAPKEPINDPEAWWQKSLNCWQTASQLAEPLPECAKYKMDAVAEAAEVSSPSITWQRLLNLTKSPFD